MSEREKIEMLPEEVEREIYHVAIEIMERDGMHQYEISNFSLSGYESRHNLKYWNREEYAGFGVSAHSFIKEKRYANVNDVKRYIYNIQNNVIEYDLFETVEEKERLWEFLILGLRKKKGINIQEFKHMANGHEKKWLKVFLKLEKNGLVEMDAANIRLTRLGMDLSNTVFVELME